jgi:hypothetical protein
MIQIRYRTILAAFVIGVTVTLVHGIALAQSSVTPARHRIHLTSQKIALPFGNKVFAGGKDAKLANSRCLLCHSRGMVDTQPPLTLETWKKEIDKMRTAYGCPLRADQTAALAEFISHASGTASAGNE